MTQEEAERFIDRYLEAMKAVLIDQILTIEHNADQVVRCALGLTGVLANQQLHAEGFYPEMV